jgi:hypothetical protein
LSYESLYTSPSHLYSGITWLPKHSHSGSHQTTREGGAYRCKSNVAPAHPTAAKLRGIRTKINSFNLVNIC